MHYEDFVIRIASGAGGTHPVFVKTPMGTAETTLRLPYDGRHLPEIAAAVRRRGAGTARTFTPSPVLSSAGALDAVSVGVTLFGALFKDPVRSLLETSLARLPRTADAGLRIRFEMNLDGPGMRDVASLPWELMRATAGEAPLAVSTRTPVVRVPDVERPPEPPPFEPPLRVLVITSNPRDTAPLALADEEARIRQTWGALDEVSVEFVAPHVSAINDACVRQNFHVIHYMGHGGFDPASGRGVLYLERPDGTADAVGADQLRAMLGDEAVNLRLVFLNACQTAMSTGKAELDPFAGVAAMLIDLGVPAVIAMQFPVTDGAAATFADTFYRRIAQGLPIDAAAAGARLELYSKGETGAEWATPVLFMRSGTGLLLKRPEAVDAEQARPVLAPVSSWHPARVAMLCGPTLALLVGLVVANYWRVPTPVMLEFRAGKVAFDVAGDAPLLLLGRSLPFWELRVRSCDTVSLRATRLAAVAPVEDTRPAGAHVFRCGPESSVRVSAPTDQRIRAGALGQLTADPGRPVVLSVAGGNVPELSVDVGTRQTLTVLTAPEVRLETDFVDLAEPPPPAPIRSQLKNGTTTYLATLDQARPAIDVVTADRVELIVMPTVGDPIADLTLMDEDAPPLAVRALQVTGGDTLSDRPLPIAGVAMSYPGVARAPVTALSDAALAVAPDLELTVHRLALTATGLNVTVRGLVRTRDEVRLASDATRVDPRLTALQRVYYGPGWLVASAFSAAVWLASTLALWWGLRRRTS